MRGGVQTVETVLTVLNAFIDTGPTPMLKSLAERADMHPAKVHRYLVSLSKHGYVRQEAATSRYRLGPAALLLGYAALNAVAAVPLARPVLKRLSTRHNCSAFMALWSEAGPRIVLQEKEAAPIAVAAHIGSIFPLLTSATGRTFAAWLPRAMTGKLLDKELAAMKRRSVQDCPVTIEEMEALFVDIRYRLLARSRGQLSRAVHGLSTPIFDAAGEICAVLTMLGRAGEFDTAWDGAVAAGLREAAESITAALRQQQGGKPARPV
jgi:DNA-binding IclR family transcriptional regulator